MASAEGLAVALRSGRGIPLAVAFDVAPGELLALVGPSGSGQTPVRRAIAGLHRPEAGAVRCHGRTWLEAPGGPCLPVQSRRVGMVFQDYALFPHLTALENLTLAMDRGSRADRARRGRELLARVHLGGLEDRAPRALSGGQQQRVAVARALAREPRVLLLDEPFAAVDTQTRLGLQEELAQLRREIGIPVVLVTHDLREAGALADRICVLHAGTGLQLATPEWIQRCPASPQVARLLGERNLFRARLRATAGGDWLDWDGLPLQLPAAAGRADGEPVDWFIPEGEVLLHRPDRPASGERENPVDARIEALMPLGGQVRVTLRCAHNGAALCLAIPAHAARRHGLRRDQAVRVSLLGRGLHVMGPAEAADGGVAGALP